MCRGTMQQVRMCSDFLLHMSRCYTHIPVKPMVDQQKNKGAFSTQIEINVIVTLFKWQHKKVASLSPNLVILQIISTIKTLNVTE